MQGPRFTELAASLPVSVPFVGPEELARRSGQPFLARLGANESGFGPSPQVISALRAQAPEIWMYGDSTSHELRHALAAHHGIAPENIVVGEGIDGLLGLLVRLVVGPGDAVVTSDGAYPTFNYHVTGFGGHLHKVPYHDDHQDTDALLAHAARTRAKLVYLCNPDNPMGSWHRGSGIEVALDALPDGCLMVLDEAYIDAAPDGTAPTIAADDPRVIRMRTFSKLYGLAGLRVGYAIGAAPLIAMFERVRNHFGVGRPVQAAALAALADQDWLAEIRTQVSAARTRIAAIGAENGLRALPSATSFVTLDCGRDGAFARALVTELGQRGVFVRMPGVAPLDRCIRVSTGPQPALDAFAAILPQALRAL
ncbi:MAG: pyridoxal phosphate-dependent aminotransferase [Roseinatronobacter sp.]